MGAKNLGRAVKFGWQAGKSSTKAKQARRAIKSGKKAAASSQNISSKIRPQKGVASSYYAGKGSYKGSRLAAKGVVGGSAAVGAKDLATKKRKKGSK